MDMKLVTHFVCDVLNHAVLALGQRRGYDIHAIFHCRPCVASAFAFFGSQVQLKFSY